MHLFSPLQKLFRGLLSLAVIFSLTVDRGMAVMWTEPAEQPPIASALQPFGQAALSFSGTSRYSNMDAFNRRAIMGAVALLIKIFPVGKRKSGGVELSSWTVQDIRKYPVRALENMLILLSVVQRKSRVKSSTDGSREVLSALQDAHRTLLTSIQTYATKRQIRQRVRDLEAAYARVFDHLETRAVLGEEYKHLLHAGLVSTLALPVIKKSFAKVTWSDLKCSTPVSATARAVEFAIVGIESAVLSILESVFPAWATREGVHAFKHQLYLRKMRFPSHFQRPLAPRVIPLLLAAAPDRQLVTVWNSHRQKLGAFRAPLVRYALREGMIAVFGPEEFPHYAWVRFTKKAATDDRLMIKRHWVRLLPAALASTLTWSLLNGRAEESSFNALSILSGTGFSPLMGVLFVFIALIPLVSKFRDRWQDNRRNQSESESVGKNLLKSRGFSIPTDEGLTLQSSNVIPFKRRGRTFKRTAA